jgi:large subunit ribosomal protein L22
MEARAISRYNRQSPRKLRLVVDLIRGKGVGDAYAILQFTKKKAAEQIDKTLARS